MKRRFGLIATRLAILALIVIAVLIGHDAIIKRIVIAKAQAWIGAKVDIGQLNASFDDRKVYVRDLAIADPRDPMKNLIQAESAVFDVDFNAVMKKQIVIEDATASRVVFAAPRTVSGRLDLFAAEKNANSSPIIPFKLAHEPSSARDEWLDRFQHASANGEDFKLEVAQTKNQILERWDTDLQQQRQRISELKDAIREVHDMVAFDPNPLRSKHLEQAEVLLKKLDDDAQQLASSLAVMDQQVVKDRDQLEQSKSRDEKRLVSQPGQRQLDGEMLSKILLHDFQIQRTKEVLDWYYGFRKMIPNPEQDFLTRNTKGVYWPIPGWEQPTGLHIKRIQLDGEGRIAGNSFNFSGAAENIASDPVALGVPTTVQLRAQGKAHAFVDYTHDQTQSDRQVDSLHISCPDLPLDSQILGDEQNLKINVSPCRTNVEMRLICRDGSIEGSLQFEHSNLVMQIQHLDELAGGIETAQRINLELASISDYRVSTNISGTMQTPFVRIESDLGDHLAMKFNEILGAKTMTAQTEIDASYRDGIASLNGDIADQVRSISQQLQDEVIAQKARVAENLSDRRDRDTFDRIIR